MEGSIIPIFEIPSTIIKYLVKTTRSILGSASVLPSKVKELRKT